MATAYIALGSNLGDRRQYLARAVQLLKDHPAIRLKRISTLHETKPVGGPPGQGDYLNAAAEIETTLSPRELLNLLLEIEHQLGRVRTEPNAPRTVDLDVLLYDLAVIHEPDLQMPHPRMHERFFVLEPLAEIAPLAVHPVQASTIRDLLEKLRSGSKSATVRELAGMRAVVTGSTSGIGKAIALELASAGADVIVHGRRSWETASAVVEAIREAGVNGAVRMADLRDPNECRKLVEAAWQVWAGVDVWVNNAGADTLTGEAAKWPFERKLAELLAVDVTATMLLSRDVGERMKAQGHGVIINMGWDQADTGMEGDSGQLFGATKGAVMAFTKSLALTLAPEVRVNCVTPGWIRTAWGEGASQEWQERVRREVPMGRWGTGEDVAKVVRWLASPAADYVTGQVIRVNGGAVRA